MAYNIDLRSLIVGAASLGCLGLTPTTSSAQSTSPDVHVSCVGGAIGCGQLDFFFQFIGAPSDGIVIDRFSLLLLSPAYRFAAPGISEAEDVLGLNFYSPAVSDDGSSLIGVFDFGAFVQPDITSVLRIRTEMAASPAGAEHADDLTFSFILESGGATIAAGTSAPGIVATPEPATLVLAVTGFLTIVGATKARRHFL